MFARNNYTMTQSERMAFETRLESNNIIEKHNRIRFTCYFKYWESVYPSQFNQLQNQINSILHGK